MMSKAPEQQQVLHQPYCSGDIDSYSRLKQIEFARFLGRRKRIYLDLNFWIDLREKRKSSATTLCQLLEEGVARGVFFCPISASTFCEIMKQHRKPEWIRDSAKLVDRLSMGASIVPSNIRIGTEFAHFMYGFRGEVELHEMQELIWTKLSYSLGYIFPEHIDLSKEANETIQRRFFDYMWNMSLSGIIEQIKEFPDEIDVSMAQSAAQLSKEIHAHASEVKSFEQTYIDELAGAVDLFRDTFAEVFCEIAARSGISPPVKGSTQWRETRRTFGNMVVNAMRLKESVRRDFRTLHILASLHAALRRDKGRNFKANDYYDFEHATAALAYCDAFFTESPLKQLVTGGHTRLHDVNNCKVAANLDDAIEITEELLASDSPIER